MTLEKLQERYEINLEKSVNEANLSLRINNVLEAFKIPYLIRTVTNGRYNGIVSFNKYSNRVILDKMNISIMEEHNRDSVMQFENEDMSVEEVLKAN